MEGNSTIGGIFLEGKYFWREFQIQIQKAEDEARKSFRHAASWSQLKDHQPTIMEEPSSREIETDRP